MHFNATSAYKYSLFYQLKREYIYLLNFQIASQIFI